jgi:penicillin-binding protein 1C
VPLEDVSPLLRDAIVLAEDRRFARHGGVDWLAVAGALRGLLDGAPPRGASTITMQLANLLDAHAGNRARTRSLAVKLRQAQRAWALERSWSKDEILEAYLNLVPFRGEVSGVGAAAGVLFGKRPHGLGAAEAAVLAVLPRGPNAPDAVVRARAARLAARAGIDLAPAQLASATAVALRPEHGARPRVALAPHLAQRLVRVATPDTGQRARPLRTTLDARLQHAAALLLEEQLRELAGRNVRDGAVLVVDNASGDVLAYVGGRGARASAPHVDGVRARRQAGSTLKPFLYATALDARVLTAASLLADTPLAVPVAGGLYQPRNYDAEFRGLVSLRSALAASLNVPAVRTLELTSADAFVGELRRLGFAGLAHGGDFYGPALALGSAEVSLEELVGAYRTLAQGGVATPLRFRHDAPAPVAADGVRVLSPEASFVIADVLADRAGRSATFGLENALATRSWAAVKTGTSKEMRDNWCVGFSSRFTVGVWVGNADGSPMHDVSGLAGAAPVWRELMDLLHGDAPSVAPRPPAGLVRVATSFARGAEPARDEWFLRGTEPGAAPPALAAPRARIVSPQPQTVLALDPDIPPALQRVGFEARGHDGPGADPARWSLDGRDLGAATGIVLWALEPGRHRLELRSAGGRTLDAVAFEVRGATSQAVAPDA